MDNDLHVAQLRKEELRILNTLIEAQQRNDHDHVKELRVDLNRIRDIIKSLKR